MAKKLVKPDPRDVYTTAFLKASDRPISEELIKKFRRQWWWNNRRKTEGGLRLTESALKYVTDVCELKVYRIEFPEEFCVTAQVLIWLDRFIDSPYYIDNRHITVLKEKSAFELYLFSGDVRKYGHNKALNKRLSQD